MGVKSEESSSPDRPKKDRNLINLLSKADRLQQNNRMLGFTFAVVRKFGDDQAGHYVALLAYYAFLATFPLLLVLVSLLGLALRSDPELQRRILNSSLSEFPVIGDQLRNNVHSLDRSGVALVFGLAVAFFGAKSLADTAQNALNALWQVPLRNRPGFAGSLLRSLGLLALIGVGAAVTGTCGTLIAASDRPLPQRGLVVLLALAMTSALFLAGFRAATSSEVPTGHLVLGSLIAAIGWQLLLTVGSLVVAHSLKGASEVYGVFAGVLGLLAWFALQAQVTLYAVEIDVVRAYRLWPRSLSNDPTTPADQAALVKYVEVQQRISGQVVGTSFTK